MTPNVPNRLPYLERLKIEQVIRAYICEAYRISWQQLISASRKTRIVNARHSYCYLLRSFTKEHVAIIGESINKDHTSALYAISKVESYLSINDEQIAPVITKFIQEVENINL